MNAQRIVSTLTVALGAFLLQPIESFATNTPGASRHGIITSPKALGVRS